MKKLIWSLLFVGMMTGIASATDTNFGLGFMLGVPTGISARIATSNTNAVDLLLGYDLYSHGVNGQTGVLYLGGDYLWYNYSLIPVSEGKLPVYYGPGIQATFSNDHSSVGIRGVLGIEYQFANAPFDLFLEVGPGINIVPNTDGNISAGFGTRYFF
jgi:hypothetical protein